MNRRIWTFAMCSTTLLVVTHVSHLTPPAPPNLYFAAIVLDDTKPAARARTPITTENSAKTNLCTANTHNDENGAGAQWVRQDERGNLDFVLQELAVAVVARVLDKPIGRAVKFLGAKIRKAARAVGVAIKSLLDRYRRRD